MKQLATQHGCRLRHVTAVDNEGLREAAPMLVYVLGRPGAGMGWGKGLGPGAGMGWGKGLGPGAGIGWGKGLGPGEGMGWGKDL